MIKLRVRGSDSIRRGRDEQRFLKYYHRFSDELNKLLLDVDFFLFDALNFKIKGRIYSFFVQIKFKNKCQFYWTGNK